MFAVWTTYINSKIQQIERARIRRIAIVGCSPVLAIPPPQAAHHHHRHGPHRGGGGRLNLDGEASAREHRHEHVGDVHQYGSEHLLRHVKEPDFHRSLWPLPPPLVHQGHEGQAAERQLHEERKGAQQAALALVIAAVPSDCHHRCRCGCNARRSRRLCHAIRSTNAHRCGQWGIRRCGYGECCGRCEVLAINELADNVVDRGVRQCGHINWVQ